MLQVCRDGVFNMLHDPNLKTFHYDRCVGHRMIIIEAGRVWLFQDRNNDGIFEAG